MKLLITISCLFAALSLVCFAFWTQAPVQAEASAQAARMGVHLLEAEKHLGIVPLNEQVNGTFTLVNDSDQPITMGEPMKSCSCATAALDAKQLAPGEHCSLAFQLRTGTRRVPRVETIGLTYVSDGAAARQMFARVFFIPKGVFEIEPAEVVLTRAQPKASFTVRGDPKADRNKVMAVKPNHRCFKVDDSALPQVTLELDLSTPDESIISTDCLIYTNNQNEELIRVPVRVRKN